jgi:uroporphyrinogen decarboxylase
MHLQNQIKAGAQVVQIFDSSGDLLSKSDYIEFSLNYNKLLAEKIKEKYPEVPVILFPRGQQGALKEIFTNKEYDVFDG